MKATPRKSVSYTQIPARVLTNTSSGEQRVCVPAWSILRRNGGRAASKESFVRLVRAYIQEYPATAHTPCIKIPENVISKIVWSSCSR